ncbi:MAG: gfo/Idh/MocA family oxidoreductase [Phycisphaerales bacterium]|nr:gfo/Idh/MocA family oxidoreductase [Phycisphaerales bacterium]MDB5354442.1 gfo/Idh/MocA family oxidoreductase [Phycisphaerales bacterium]
MRISLIGCGLIGNKRTKALGPHALVACADTNLARAQALAAQHPGCLASTDWRLAATRDDVDVVIVSTTNDVLAPATFAAIQSGKHVLVEKPAARNAAELEPVARAARDARSIVKVGFNHRFHPALLKAREIIDTGVLGPLMFVRARYGHGGRLGMEKEWRGNPAISGGGEMLDQGVHLIDLARWFLGDFAEVSGHVGTFFWDWPVEDNGFALLKTSSGQVAWLHASCTEWKNCFSFEIYGKTGKLHIEGLGGSYGVERLSFYRMLPQMGPPETTIWEYPGEDRSWHLEFEHFMSCIAQKKQPIGSLDDALAALRVVDQLYGK